MADSSRGQVESFPLTEVTVLVAAIIVLNVVSQFTDIWSAIGILLTLFLLFTGLLLAPEIMPRP